MKKALLAGITLFAATPIIATAAHATVYNYVVTSSADYGTGTPNNYLPDGTVLAQLSVDSGVTDVDFFAGQCGPGGCQQYSGDATGFVSLAVRPPYNPAEIFAPPFTQNVTFLGTVDLNLSLDSQGATGSLGVYGATNTLVIPANGTATFSSDVNGCGDLVTKCVITGYWINASTPLPEPAPLGLLLSGAVMAITAGATAARGAGKRSTT